jgi:BirA family biotin operon repressor/biotin-[acetyl-CoA-carboxylase] ligase
VVGIGLNVEQRSFPDELASLATSLVLSGASERAREPLLAEVLSALEARVARLESAGVAGISEELRRHDALSGKRLRVGELEGTGAGIDETGQLLLRQTDGTISAVSSGHVTLLSA